ncbi:MAG: hypothetical protein VX975_07145, partial [Acidobacteriota bacterium]|nr:hypothetical protein [Acidobacteriota bacterium]
FRVCWSSSSLAGCLVAMAAGFIERTAVAERRHGSDPAEEKPNAVPGGMHRRPNAAVLMTRAR